MILANFFLFRLFSILKLPEKIGRATCIERIIFLTFVTSLKLVQMLKKKGNLFSSSSSPLLLFLPLSENKMR